MKKSTVMTAGLVLAAALAAPAQAAIIEITEWMYSGNGGEFIEFTNVSGAPVDLTGWSYDDESRNPGSFNLSSIGILAPGESFIVTEDSASTFRTDWGLSAAVKIAGGNTHNIGRSDEINIYDNLNQLVDRLTYNDQAGQGPRTQYKSCNIPAADYGLTVASSAWTLASVGDSYGSWQSTKGDIGSPGQIPEPAGLLLAAAGSLMLVRRRR